MKKNNLKISVESDFNAKIISDKIKKFKEKKTYLILKIITLKILILI